MIGGSALREKTYSEKLRDRALELTEKVADDRAPKYKIAPVEYIDISKIVVQMNIKTERALQAITIGDKIDELIDAVNYGLFAIGRLDKERPDGECVVVNLDSTNHSGCEP